MKELRGHVLYEFIYGVLQLRLKLDSQNKKIEKGNE